MAKITDKVSAPKPKQISDASDQSIYDAFFSKPLGKTAKVSVPDIKQEKKIAADTSDQSIYDAFFSKPVAKVVIPPLPSQAATNPLLAGTKLTNIPPLPAKVPNNPLV